MDICLVQKDNKTGRLIKSVVKDRDVTHDDDNSMIETEISGYFANEKASNDLCPSFFGG